MNVLVISGGIVVTAPPTQMSDMVRVIAYRTYHILLPVTSHLADGEKLDAKFLKEGAYHPERYVETLLG